LNLSKLKKSGLIFISERIVIRLVKHISITLFQEKRSVQEAVGPDRARLARAFLVECSRLHRRYCPDCNALTRFSNLGRDQIRCLNCNFTLYPEAGTIFSGSKVPLDKWVEAIFAMNESEDGVSSKELSALLKITQKTAWMMINRLKIASSLKSFWR
jgi:transposase-like protein